MLLAFLLNGHIQIEEEVWGKLFFCHGNNKKVINNFIAKEK